MFCPRCGTQNPDSGKFCRTCGTDLNTVSKALTGKLQLTDRAALTNRRGRTMSWESAFGKLFMGIAFVAVSIALANSAVGRGWWFWMLIPALSMIGAGLAQVFQIRRYENANGVAGNAQGPGELGAREASALPAGQTDYVSPAERTPYHTGELVPPGVTEGTTRLLELDPEKATMTLPEREP